MFHTLGEAFHDLAEWTEEMVLLIVKCPLPHTKLFARATGTTAQ